MLKQAGGKELNCLAWPVIAVAAIQLTDLIEVLATDKTFGQVFTRERAIVCLASPLIGFLPSFPTSWISKWRGERAGVFLQGKCQ